MIDDHQVHQVGIEIGDSPEIEIEIEIEEVGVDHQEDHLGKILGVMQRGLIWNDLIGFYSLGILVYVYISPSRINPLRIYFQGSSEWRRKRINR
jgi:hypothetical protein